MSLDHLPFPLFIILFLKAGLKKKKICQDDGIYVPKIVSCQIQKNGTSFSVFTPLCGLQQSYHKVRYKRVCSRGRGSELDSLHHILPQYSCGTEVSRCTSKVLPWGINTPEKQMLKKKKKKNLVIRALKFQTFNQQLFLNCMYHNGTAV